MNIYKIILNCFDIHFYMFSVIFHVSIGIQHFIDPFFFIAIVPASLESKKILVYVSGFIEIIMGSLLLFAKTRKIGAYGIILLLISVFPANIYLYISDVARDTLQISKKQALIRMPFQIPLIMLAYWHAKESTSKKFSIICIILFIPTIIYFATL